MIGFLASVAAFRGLDESALHILEQNIERLKLPAAEILFRQGDPGDSFYLVVSGTLQVTVTLPDGRKQPLAKLSSGDWVGEMALLFQKPRSATVYASCDSELLKIRPSALDRLFVAHPMARKQLLDFASRRLPSLYLASMPLLAGMDMPTLREFDGESHWLRLAGGETLFKQGDPPDYLYVVVHGRLAVIVDRKNGEQELIGQIGRGACVGEMALLTGEPRSATVRAIRDSELIRLSKDEFHFLLDRHPRGAIEIARTLARRLRQTTVAENPKPGVSTIALVPSHHDGLPPGFAQQFVEALSAVGGSTLHLSSHRLDLELGEGAASLADEASHSRIINWLTEQENRSQYVVSECDPSPSTWTDLCLRQADLILIVAQADSDPLPGEIEERLFKQEMGNRFTRKELVLVHPNGKERPVGTMRWLRVRQVASHHHVRVNCADDYHRLARIVTGRAIGVVFSGGGARGIAHIGVVKAMRECGLPIDLVGGTSMGSAIAAVCAMGYDIETMIENATDFGKRFSDLNRIRDVTFPFVALNSAHRFVKILQTIFRDVHVEDLWLRYFCVSSNLSRAETVVHEEGPLWLAIRASSSIPGIWPPVFLRGELLVDGGVLNNLPVDVMRSRSDGPIVAIDVSEQIDLMTDTDLCVALSGWPLLWNRMNPFAKKSSLPHIFGILARTAVLGSTYNTATIRGQADLYLHPPTSEVDMFDWKSAHNLVEIGYRYALGEIEKWRKSRSICGSNPPTGSELEDHTFMQDANNAKGVTH